MVVSSIARGTKVKDGFLKIKSFAKRAKADRFDWVWVDTCCIDKTSSADLSESINSMYRWYAEASVCYVYLSDYMHEDPRLVVSTDLRGKVSQCRWFGRGWTLQELIAPRHVQFHAQNWKPCFTKANSSVPLSAITGISEGVLAGSIDPLACSMAQRMSWASKRQTTRSEDMAYCLLGLFGIAMPMLYGEGGQRAFIRLQQEILKGPFDQSLFAWTAPDIKPFTYRGLLARHPREFEFSGHIRRQTKKHFRPGANLSKISVSNLGFKVGFIRLNLPTKSLNGTYFAMLQCIPNEIFEYPTEEEDYICIMVKKVMDHPETYVRVNAGQLYHKADCGGPSDRGDRFYIPVDTVTHLQLEIPFNYL